MLIYHIEDDDIQADFWGDEIRKEVPGANVKWFKSAYDAWRSAGNPAAIIFDVGSIGLSQHDHKYLSTYRQLRDKFPGTPIFLISGMDYLPAMIMEEMGEDAEAGLVIPVPSYDKLTDYVRGFLCS